VSGAGGRAAGPRPENASFARLAPLVLPVGAAGWGLAVAAALTLDVVAPASAEGLLGAAAILAAAALCEAFPVPLDGVPAGGVSLAAAFLIGAALVFDWQTATLVALLTRAAVELVRWRSLLGFVYTSAVYALAAAAAAAAAGRFENAPGDTSLVLAVAAASLAFYSVNVALVALAAARAGGAALTQVVARSVRGTATPFAMLASVALILDVLWLRSPFLSIALLGPLVAVALYQRSTRGTIEAMRLARTDPLTGLGNHRSFQERLVEELERSAATRDPLGLCLLDVDGFKGINDAYGHQAGDDVLVRLGRHLAAAGDAFRLGGDEFAILQRGRRPQEALMGTTELVSRICRERYGIDGTVTVSAGVASFPEHGTQADELFGAADAALYRAKHGGKNQVQLYDRRRLGLESARSQQLQLRLRAVRRLAELVDAAGGVRDPALDEGHSDRVAELAGHVAERAGLDREHAELVRLAGRLHDLGKLAIPLEILTKEAELGEREREVVREHPEVGCSILRALGAAPIADWVLHQNERWDGRGYPSGLRGEEIPIASRIILVANAYDAIVSPRPYREARAPAQAIAELRRCAGSQFDPGVVAALIAVLEQGPAESLAASG
jgi:diguanylate cyclase (GGDEF)-like protein